MHDYYWGGNGWGGWTIVHAGVWVLLLVLVVFAVVALSRGRGRSGSALDSLNERYARGEIDRDEYLQRKKDIREG